MTRLLALPLVASLAVPAAFDAGVSADRAVGAPITRTVYVVATDNKRAPVTDLKPDEFVVKEDGKTREVVKAELASDPLQVAIIVDDNGTGLFRAGIATFVQRLLGRNQFAISTVTGQVMRVTDFTSDVKTLSEAITGLKARAGAPDGGQLLAGISEAARDHTKRRAGRPIILALTVGGEEHSTLPAHHVLDQLRDSGAALYVTSVAPSALRGTAAVEKPADLLEGPLNLNEVLGDGSKQSGGRHDAIVAAAGIVAGLQLIAEELANQYVVSYVLPEGVKPNEKLNVTVKRRGVQVRAPSRIPER
jgi:VWFA-related protein